MKKQQLKLWAMTILSSILIFYGITLLQEAKAKQKSASSSAQSVQSPEAP